MRFRIIILIILSATVQAQAENGHDLWLRAEKNATVTALCAKNSPTLTIARKELEQGWRGKDGAKVNLVVKNDRAIRGDGFKLSANTVQANTEIGVLYSVYEVLRRQQTGQFFREEIISNPSYQRRILNHWDNMDGSIERGYAGNSIFWRNNEEGYTVTERDKTLWKEYARANASIGINGAVLNNVNASPLILTSECLQKVKAIADALRPYGITTYLSIKFSSPSLIGGLKTSDPLNPGVIKWWNDKINEISTSSQ
ncbi:MAG: hypothetical protein LBP72_07845 [Dysgonamonadaceae bacterium]|nr:hypothetical protein [Dysgonamonadaceae bacterium]